MAIALGQPVDEITHGLEVMKIDSHVMASERAMEAQAASPAEIRNVQALPVEGHQSLGGERAVRLNPSEVPCVDHQSMLFPSMELAQPCIDYVDINQFPTSEAPKFLPHFQGPVYTGYPAPIVSVPGYMPFSAEGVIFPNPVVEYNPVYNQNFYCSAPCAVGHFNYDYGQPQVYPQYQVVPPEQCGVAAPLPQNEGTVLPEGSFMSFGYQPLSSEFGHGQMVSMAMAGSFPAFDDVPGYFSVPPYAPVSMPHVLSVAAPAWVQQPVNANTFKDETKHVQSKSGFQQLSEGNLIVPKSSVEKVDNRVPVPLADVKKQARKQYGPGSFFGVPMPIKGAWVRPGQLPCASANQPLKPLGGKNKGGPYSHLSVEQFNLSTFSTDFEDARHFIIKSFSDENVYRSVQHGVWASTPHGNKKLDEAFQDAQCRAEGKAKGCPVFLYFSVNGSGRFCGVAEMTGPVDFNTTMDFWERNRWCGSFPVKWHFIKDVPHCQLRRIILQNNENKPVTSSRDTQEVNLEQGLLMLNIIKSYSTTASILDNFPALSGTRKIVPEIKSSADRRVVAEGTVVAVSESDIAKGCNVEVNARETDLQGKLSQGKAETLAQDAAVDIAGRKLDKENVKVSDTA